MPLTYVGKLTLAEIIPGYNEALEKVFDQEDAINAQLENNVRELGAIQKKVDFLSSTLSTSQDAVTAASNVLAEAQGVLSEIQDLRSRLEDSLSQGGIYFYYFSGRANQLGSDISSELTSGLSGGTSYGPDEAIAAAIFISGSDGGIAASGERVVNMFKTMGVNFEEIRDSFESVYQSVETEFGPQD